MKIIAFCSRMAILILLMASCNNQPSKEGESVAIKLVEENVNYSADGLTMKGFIAYQDSGTAKKPAVIVVPEWWGLNDYAKKRASMLAELGYVAMAMDMYGEGKTADNPQDAGVFALPFYADPQMAKSRFDSALATLKRYQQVDTNNIAAIGYCFGGAVALNVAKLGSELKGVVSFHGNLAGVPANKELLKSKILVCHGAEDVMVNAEVAPFRKEMDSIGADYTFKSYPNATHAFSNPAATEKGKQFNIPIAYNKEADLASWADMKVFLADLFNKNAE